MNNIKIVIVGDGGVGKSSLLITYSTNSFPQDYVPTVFDNYISNVLYKSNAYSLQLWDTAGQEDYDRLRPLSYPHTDVFLICYSIDRKTSLQNVAPKWKTELEHHCPSAKIILVGNKIDLRDQLINSGREYCTYSDGEKVAKEIGADGFFETSALHHTNIKDLFDECLRLSVEGTKPKKKKGKDVLQPPELPKQERAPWIYPSDSSFANDWKKLLNNERFSDVVFKLKEDKVIYAHKIILCSAASCSIFRRIFNLLTNEDKKLNRNPIDFHEINKGQISGFDKIEQITDNDNKLKTYISVSNTISYSVWYKFMEFLYTGNVTLQKKDSDLIDLISLSNLMDCQFLNDFCSNVQNNTTEFNPSIGTYMNDKSGEIALELFFNRGIESDISFKVENKSLNAHKSIVSIRSNVLDVMLNGSFSESKQKMVKITDMNYDIFKGVLEYIYSDHTDIENVDPLGFIEVANLYGFERLLTLSELYASKIIEKETTDQIEKSNIDVIGILQFAQSHNAKQLAQFCLHFISNNYEPFLRRPEYKKLSPENLEYIEKHRWPPLSYYEELEKYRKQQKENDPCSIM